MALEVDASPASSGADAQHPTGAATFRTFAAGDTEAFLDAFAASWSADGLSGEWLTNRLLLDGNFDPDGFILAVDDDRIVGATYAVVARDPTPGLAPDGGWIPFLFVIPQRRRSGVGSGLLERATAFLRDHGANWANVAGYGPGYLTPGVDVSHEPGAASFLLDRGFEIVEEPASMGMAIDGYEIPEQVQALTADAESAGFRFHACRPGDLPELVAFATTVAGGDWGVVLRDSVLRGGSPERIQLVRSPDGGIVGFATFGSYEGVLERFGPFGVDPRMRGRALGKILLHRCLAAMRHRGLHEAWFLWTDADGPAGRLYAQTGFRVLRRFAVMQKTL